MHQNRSHHHHGTAEGRFTAKKWFGHRAGRSPCAHSISKFFLCYIVLFSSETSAPGSPGNYLYTYLHYNLHMLQYAPYICILYACEALSEFLLSQLSQSLGLRFGWELIILQGFLPALTFYVSSVCSCHRCSFIPDNDDVVQM